MLSSGDIGKFSMYSCNFGNLQSNALQSFDLWIASFYFWFVGWEPIRFHPVMVKSKLDLIKVKNQSNSLLSFDLLYWSMGANEILSCDVGVSSFIRTARPLVQLPVQQSCNILSFAKAEQHSFRYFLVTSSAIFCAWCDIVTQCTSIIWHRRITTKGFDIAVIIVAMVTTS